MSLNKSLLTTTVASALFIANVTLVQADIVTARFNGYFTMLEGQSSNPVQNTSEPYTSDVTWGYGLRTQIYGNLDFELSTGFGILTIAPFDFLDSGQMKITDFEFQVGAEIEEFTIMIANFNSSWNGNIFTSQIVLDGSGFFSAMDPSSTSSFFAGALLTQDVCINDVTVSCAIPASDGIENGGYPIGPALLATSSINTIGQTGFGTTITQLSLGADDGIGGSPIDNGDFEGYSINLDITDLYLCPSGACPPFTTSPVVPIPPAVWLFGSGLLGLIGVARRKKA